MGNKNKSLSSNEKNQKTKESKSKKDKKAQAEKKEISVFDLLQFSVENPKTVKYFIFNLIKLFIVSLRVSNPCS